MKQITQEELNKIIENHQHWVKEDCENWEDMKADLSDTNLSGANMSGADMSGADMSYADMSGADMSGADMSGANMRNANMRNANMSGADMSYADMSGADMSGADGILSAIDFLKKHFEFTKDGIIAYKTFGGSYNSPEDWVLQSGSVITENVNPCRNCDCGCGINVAPLKWVKDNYDGDIWKVLIRWKWLAGVVVPYNSDGKIRCERVELIKIVENN